MSYLSHAQDPRRRATAVAGVVAIHALVGVVLVTGLQFTGAINLKPPIEATFIPDEIETPPPPPPVDEIVPEVPRQDFIAPAPLIDLTPVTPIQPKPFDPLIIPDPVVIPRPAAEIVPQPKPQPQPSFAPKRAAPKNDVARWVMTEDYPSRALRDGAEGVAGFRVVVGSDGKVDACEITSSSGNALLDEATCKNVTRRARFEPATDGSGQKTVGSFSSQVRWQIPQ